MEADDLLCSRNARPEKALVGRAQWETIYLALSGEYRRAVVAQCAQLGSFHPILVRTRMISTHARTVERRVFGVR
jgi:hypothetical protein